MGAPRAITKHVLGLSDGETLVMERKPKQTADAFARMVQNYRMRWKKQYGIESRSSVVGDVATVFIIRGLGKTKAEVGAMTLGPGSFKTQAAATAATAAAAAPETEPPFVVDDDESRQFWKDVFLESLRVMPAAPPEFHCTNARAAVEAYGRRWGNANG